MLTNNYSISAHVGHVWKKCVEITINNGTMINHDDTVNGYSQTKLYLDVCAVDILINDLQEAKAELLKQQESCSQGQ